MGGEGKRGDIESEGEIEREGEGKTTRERMKE